MIILKGKGVGKVVFFLNLHKNKSNKNISLVTKIVLVILLICVLSDKSGAFNIPQNISRMQSFNLDFIANELMMFSKFSLNYSFLMTLGLICITAGVLLAITYGVMSFKEEIKNNECVESYSYKVESAKSLYTSNIYLINNQFLC